MMWTRMELKASAKGVLKRTYWLSFAVCLVAGILSGGSGGSGGVNSTRTNNYFKSIPAEMLAIIIVIILAVVVMGIAYSIFIASPVIVGKDNFFMKSRVMDTPFTTLFSSFNRGNNYLNIVRTMFFKSLYTFFWTLLFIVPGIIKAYEYTFIPYILAENSSISSQRAFEISKAMTKGQKFNIFVLGLSFLGWQLLGIMLCCIGVLFVTPYTEATFAELYAVCREEALASGDASASELIGFDI